MIALIITLILIYILIPLYGWLAGNAGYKTRKQSNKKM